MLDPKRWAEVDALLDAALDQPAEERTRWLDEACRGDAELRAEVERLIALSEEGADTLRPGGGMAGPLWDEVATELEPSAKCSGLRIGDRMGGYRVIELLGRGGMGRVYVAEDERLGRQIALKILPPELASPERRRRFEREARSIAALNHPNIVHVYSVEEADGIPFITMELVRGQTLEALIGQSLSLKQLLDLAVPLVDALAAAHEQGVIHRDLKPANVMVSAEGRVKVLDFGLAKWQDESPLANLSSEATAEGQILGTVSHMSPEQAQGKPIDHRTDIFSLGVVLYELSTGTRPFRGDSAASILSSVLRDDPPPASDLNARLPRDWNRIVRRCLAKDPGKRYQTAVDLRNDLEELRYELDSRKLFHSAPPPRALAPALAGLLALILGSMLAVALFLRPGGRALAPAEGVFAQLTSDPGQELFPTLSPDGRFVAYASRIGASWDVFLLRAGGSRPINLTEDSAADDTQPVFSPDGEHIAFRSSREGGGIFVMGATGELARRVTELGWNPAWAPDGREIAFATQPIFTSPFDRPTRSELWVVALEDGRVRRAAERDAVQPSWSPHGHRIAFWGLREESAQRDLWTVPADGGSPVPLTDDAAVDWNPVWSPDGRYVYFSSDRGGSMNLWRIPLDEESGERRGPPERVTTPSPYAHHVSIAANGTRLAFVSTMTQQELHSVAFDPETETAIAPSRSVARDLRSVAFPHPSPDGEWIVFANTTPQEDLFLIRPDGTDRRQLTDDAHRDRRPRWSPDGERIAFYSNRSGTYEIWEIRRDAGALRQLTWLGGKNARYPVWSPDGSRMVFSSPGLSGIVFRPDLAWEGQSAEELPPFDGPGEEFVPMDWSPDGERLAGYVQTAEGARAGIVAYSLAERAYERLTEHGFWPVWFPDGRRILFQALHPSSSAQEHEPERSHGLYRVHLDTGDVREVYAQPGASVESPSFSADYRAIYFVLANVESDVWMLSTEEAR